MKTYVQWQVQTDHITGRQQLIKGHVLCSSSQVLTQLPTVVVDDLHAKRLGLLLEIPSNTTHAQNTQDFALGIVSENGCRLTAPLALAQGLHTGVEVTQSPDNQEHVHVGCCVVHGCGDVGNANWGVTGTAGVDIHLVIPGSWMSVT